MKAYKNSEGQTQSPREKQKNRQRQNAEGPRNENRSNMSGMTHRANTQMNWHRLCPNSGSASFEGLIWSPVTSQCCVKACPNSPKFEGLSKCALQMCPPFQPLGAAAEDTPRLSFAASGIPRCFARCCCAIDKTELKWRRRHLVGFERKSIQISHFKTFGFYSHPSIEHPTPYMFNQNPPKLS